MSEHGTTGACGPECVHLIGLKSGRKRHRFVLELAADMDRKRAYYAAGYTGENWTQNVEVMLRNPDVSRCVQLHCSSKDQSVEDWGEELRGLTKARARAKVPDYMTQGDPNPAELKRLYRILTEGIEDRESEGGTYSPVEDVEIDLPPGRRPATNRQIGKAILAAARPSFKDWSELTDEQLAGIDEYAMDRHGNVKIKTSGPWASQLSAKLEGLLIERHAVTWEQRQEDANKIGADYIKAMEAEVASEELVEEILEALVSSWGEDEEEALRAVLVGVPARVCGRLG